MKTCIFIFHRDLRISDNKGLSLAASKYDKIVPIFIFTSTQVTNTNKFLSKNSVQFMIESLDDLATSLKEDHGRLYCFYGDTISVLSRLIKQVNADAICFNRDITPFSKRRDASVAELCKKEGIECLVADDYYLAVPGSIKKDNGEPYHKFTPFYQAFIHSTNRDGTHNTNRDTTSSGKPSSKHWATFNASGTIGLEDAYLHYGALNPDAKVSGGRTYGLAALKKAVVEQSHYATTRNDLTKDTSLLSAYIKFGCVSIREVANAFSRNREFYRQLVWREFYAGLLDMHPEMISEKSRLLKVNWTKNQAWFNAWKTGRTGYPIVDACMRQLNQTGYMHNRGRLIVASFLVKTLLIDWREGERYFAQQLLDYDVASNNGNWRWIAGEGVLVNTPEGEHAYHFDSQPYFRIMNPWLQSKNFDVKGEYIKQWIPELADVEARDLHNWFSDDVRKKYEGLHYPDPIVDYSERKKIVLKAYTNKET